MGCGRDNAVAHTRARCVHRPEGRLRAMRSGRGVADFLSVQVTMIVSFCRDMTSQLRKLRVQCGYSIV